MLMINRCPSEVRRTLKFVKKMLKPVDPEQFMYKDVEILHYQNGRETGFTIRFFTNKWFANSKKMMDGITFAEHRNSDNIVVYLCDWHNDFENEREHAYRRSKTFYSAEEAAGYIFRNLMQSMRKAEKQET